MVTFDQRSANSFILRAITNRVNHMDSPLILTQENVAGNKERWKKKGRAGAQTEAGGWDGSHVAIRLLLPSARILKGLSKGTPGDPYQSIFPWPPP